MAVDRGAVAVLWYGADHAIGGAAVPEGAYEPDVPSAYVAKRVFEHLLRDTGWDVTRYKEEIAEGPRPLETGKRLRFQAEVVLHPGGHARNVLGMLSNPRTTVIDTIKLFIDNDRDELNKTMRAADYIAINDSEARELTGTASIASAATSLLESGVQSAIIKLGEYGAVIKTATDHFVAAGYPLEKVIDPTGAGDAFAGGFSGYLDSVETIDKATIRQAIVYASAVASFTVEGFGPSRLLDVTRAEVDARYKEFRELTHFEAERDG